MYSLCTHFTYFLSTSYSEYKYIPAIHTQCLVIHRSYINPIGLYPARKPNPAWIYHLNTLIDYLRSAIARNIYAQLR